MNITNKAVLRFIDGKILKGYLKEFSSDTDVVTLQETETNTVFTVNFDQLKAIFFVKSFEGNRDHREKKSYGITKQKGQKIFIKFTDNEDLVGFLDGPLPWKKGYFLSKNEGAAIKGFFILPVDPNSNNIKVFVVSSSVIDVTVMP